MSIWTDLSNVPFRLDFVAAGGVRTRALQVGEGELVLFLHGTSSHLEVFAPNVREFARAGFAAHAIDMRGHGYSDKATRNLEVPDYVAHVSDYLDAVGAERVHLVGESLGGWVAAWFASEHQDRVASLQLVSSGGTLAVPEVMARIRSTTELAANDPDPAYTRDRLAKLFFDPSRASEELVDVRYRIYHEPDFQAALHYLLCMQDMEVRQRNLLTPERMGRITAPTQIFWGRFNPMGAVPEAEGIHAAIADSRLTVFEECGHFPQLEYPERFNAESIAFLRSIGAGG
ncbi:MAG: alpha/beta hydrolase [Rhodoglobus sp.]|nr:alpha/beta hydrolase [Rhodoglobus sp.]